MQRRRAESARDESPGASGAAQDHFVRAGREIVGGIADGRQKLRHSAVELQHAANNDDVVGVAERVRGDSAEHRARAFAEEFRG